MAFCKGSIQGFALIASSLLITACGGGGDGDGGSVTPCDTPLTVEYINNEFLTEDLFVLGGYSASDTTLIHTDGNQGNDFDIDKIFLSRVTHTNGNSLAVSTSTFATNYPSNDTYMVFFIDADKNAATGAPIDGIGADALILDSLPNDGGPTPSTAAFQIWDINSSRWVGTATLGTTSTVASYLAGCTMGISIFIPMHEGVDLLYARDVRGVMKLVRLSNGDPNTPVLVPPIDSTTVFDFMVP